MKQRLLLLLLALLITLSLVLILVPLNFSPEELVRTVCMVYYNEQLQSGFIDCPSLEFDYNRLFNIYVSESKTRFQTSFQIWSRWNAILRLSFSSQQIGSGNLFKVTVFVRFKQYAHNINLQNQTPSFNHHKTHVGPIRPLRPGIR